jgi:beta-lactamase class A
MIKMWKRVISVTFTIALMSLAFWPSARSVPAPLKPQIGARALQKSASARAAAEREIARIALTAGGEVGVSVRHLESGLTLSLNESEMFPMASTFKIAVAGAVLARVDAGQFSLEQMIVVDPALVSSSEGIAEIFPFVGVSASVRNLIESMLTRSDNTATNVLVALVGGPAAVTAWVRSTGVVNMRIDGDTNGIIGRFFGLPVNSGSIDAQLRKLFAVNPSLAEISGKPNDSFDNDLRDSTTPTAMTDLLSKIIDTHILSRSSTDLLLGSMQRCITGLKRLRGRLPPETTVQDKTGTLGGSVNDVGIIALPGTQGRIVIAVYVKKSTKPMEERERAIAEIARLVYDYMLIEAAQSK